MIYTENFCKNIKKLRASHHLTKTEMSERLGISVKTLNTIESGEIPKRLSLKVVYAAMDAFGVNPADLFK